VPQVTMNTDSSRVVLFLRHPREYRHHSVGIQQAVSGDRPTMLPEVSWEESQDCRRTASGLGYLSEAALPIVAPLVALGFMMPLLPFV
jgi:hypothetical protein